VRIASGVVSSESMNQEFSRSVLGKFWIVENFLELTPTIPNTWSVHINFRVAPDGTGISDNFSFASMELSSHIRKLKNKISILINFF